MSAGPADALAGAARGESAAVVVLGPTHRHSIARVLEETARRLLHETPCPVAVAPAGFADRAKEPLQRIGVGYERTPEAHAALMTAHALAARAGATLRAIGVVLPLAPLAIDDVRDWTAYYDEERRNVDGELTRALDLLVCGSRGRGPVRALLLGSVTERLLRAAACALLIVPRPVDGAR